MFGWGSGKKSRWENVDYMSLVPAHAHQWLEDADTGRVLVMMPRYTDPLFSRLLQPRLSDDKKHIRVPLEGRGTFLWHLIDGQKSVADLVRAFETEYPGDSENVPNRVSMYLHAMYDNNFIKYLNLAT